MNDRDREKKLAAEAAVERVEDGMRVGLGTGSTAVHAVRALGERVRAGLAIVGVPTSKETERVAQAAAIPLDDLGETPHLDVTIDGADEVDGRLGLIKGGGGALLREKIVASATDRLIVVVDGTKVVGRLGAFPLPVEVIPFATGIVVERIRALGAQPVLRLQEGGSPFVTDEGNYILDCPFGPLDDAEGLAAHLSSVTGVVEHGLFLGMATEVIVARGGQIDVLRAAHAD